MKFKDTFSKQITCPRCGLKVYEGIDTCPDCGLIFSRLDLATNKDAKKLILRRETDFIVKTNKLPKDVSRLKLILYSIFFGAVGGHCFYVGRYFRGAFLLIDFLLIMCYTIFNDALIAVDGGTLLGVLSTISGLCMFVWVYDFFMILFKRFKVPIAIDITKSEEIEAQRSEFMRDVQDLQNAKDDNEKIINEKDKNSMLQAENQVDEVSNDLDSKENSSSLENNGNIMPINQDNVKAENVNKSKQKPKNQKNKKKSKSKKKKKKK